MEKPKVIFTSELEAFDLYRTRNANTFLCINENHSICLGRLGDFCEWGESDQTPQIIETRHPDANSDAPVELIGNLTFFKGIDVFPTKSDMSELFDRFLLTEGND